MLLVAPMKVGSLVYRMIWLFCIPDDQMRPVSDHIPICFDVINFNVGFIIPPSDRLQSYCHKPKQCPVFLVLNYTIICQRCGWILSHWLRTWSQSPGVAWMECLDVNDAPYFSHILSEYLLSFPFDSASYINYHSFWDQVNLHAPIVILVNFRPWRNYKAGGFS